MLSVNKLIAITAILSLFLGVAHRAAATFVDVHPHRKISRGLITINPIPPPRCGSIRIAHRRHARSIWYSNIKEPTAYNSAPHIRQLSTELRGDSVASSQLYAASYQKQRCCVYKLLRDEAVTKRYSVVDKMHFNTKQAQVFRRCFDMLCIKCLHQLSD